VKIQINIKKQYLVLLIAVILIASVGVAIAALDTNKGWHATSQISTLDTHLATLDNKASLVDEHLATLDSKASSACRLCIDSCGNGYTNEAGAIHTDILDENRYAVVAVYYAGCTGSLTAWCTATDYCNSGNFGLGQNHWLRICCK
jgi:hypothetical protein